MSDTERRLLTIDEVAERLGQSRRTIERKIRAGELPVLHLGGPRTAIRVDERELERWLYRDPKDVDPSRRQELEGIHRPFAKLTAVFLEGRALTPRSQHFSPRFETTLSDRGPNR